MNKVQTNQFRMFTNTRATLDANSLLWSGIPVMVTSKNELDEVYQRIEEVNEKTVVRSKSVTADKAMVLNNLIEKVLVLSGVMQAYAAFTDNTVLADKVKLVKSDITKVKETDVEAIITPVLTEARKEIDNLTDYGISEALITEAETSLDDYKVLIGQPRTIRNKAFAAMNLLDELFDAANAIIKNKLDKLMIRFKYTHTEFYSEYERARTIVD